MQNRILFINAAFREGSRTGALARAYLNTCSGEITEIDLGDASIAPLRRDSLRVYNRSVQADCFDDPMFDAAKQFVTADEIVIAAPFWNFGIPAVLHDYLELVCTQGISFGLTGQGEYFGKCRAQKLTFITTSGGYIPEDDHAFGYVRFLADYFWKIPEIRCIKAEGLDVYGVDPQAEIDKAIARI